MAKKYTRKQVSSLAELDLEQARIKYKTQRIEDDMLNLINPQQLAMSLITGWLSRKSSGKKAQQYFAASDKKKKTGTGKAGKTKGAVLGFLSRPTVKNTAKKIGISFLKWQAFNLALFAGKKIWHKIKESKHRKVAALSS